MKPSRVFLNRGLKDEASELQAWCRVQGRLLRSKTQILVLRGFGFEAMISLASGLAWRSQDVLSEGREGWETRLMASKISCS